MKELDIETKVTYLRIGLGLVNINAPESVIEKIVKVYDKILEKGGDFDIHDAVEIEVGVDGKYSEKEIKAIPNKRTKKKQTP